MNINDAKDTLSDVCPGDLLVRWDGVTSLVVEIFEEPSQEDLDPYMKYGRHVTCLTTEGDHVSSFMSYIEFLLTVERVERGK